LGARRGVACTFVRLADLAEKIVKGDIVNGDRPCVATPQSGGAANREQRPIYPLCKAKPR